MSANVRRQLIAPEGHTALALLKLLEEYKEKAKLEGIVSSYTNRIQELEDACWEVIDHNGIDDLEGIALDDLGVLVGRGRFDLSDTDYRFALKAQIRINRSSGTTTDLAEVALLSVPDGTILDYEEYYPASCRFKIVSIFGTWLLTFWYNLRSTKMAGVRFWVEYTDQLQNKVFTLGSQTSTELEAGYVSQNGTSLGLGDSVSGGVGGRLTSVIG